MIDYKKKLIETDICLSMYNLDLIDKIGNLSNLFVFNENYFSFINTRYYKRAEIKDISSLISESIKNKVIQQNVKVE